MTSLLRHISIGLLLALLLINPSAKAESVKSVFRYTDLAEVREFVARMESVHGLSRAGVMSVLRRANRRQDILDLLARPAEKTLYWPQYRGIFIQPKRVSAGMNWHKKHRDIFRQVSKMYGVPTEIILAIIGVETYYGKHMGRYPVYESLTTLAFEENRRQSFFRKELEQFFLMAHEQKLNPLSLMGSYAGALGLGQFIPSSYRHWAVDFDGNGSINLVNEPGDAIASVANYLADHGWKKDLGIAWPVRLKREGSEKELASWRKTQRPKTKLRQWISSGVVDADSLPPALQQMLAQNKNIAVSLVYLPEKNGGQYWLGSKNFYVITRYNHSNLYAMAVFQLSTMIGKNGKIDYK